ncbi:23856_t:CDS:2 [Dentiscutata erythropus]|uniref:23856_t:CDS:1 n=1 Tax=Dentiscutata erythropus TaxID=1348616 RepID=A0A9N9FV74_9GLOM|nr:23856_t:CDS:2 [Dentiscutata erythropus]
MFLKHNDLAKNLLLSYCFIYLLCNFTVNGYNIIYSSSKNDLQYKNFDVNSSHDGALVIKIFDDHNSNNYKGIHTLLPNGSTTYIDLDFANKSINIDRIFPLTMSLYFLLYDDVVDGSKQVTGMLIDWNNHIIKEFSVFSMIDGNYGFVTTEALSVNYSTLNTSVSTIYLHYSLLSLSTLSISEKFLLYSAKNVNNIVFISCSSSYSEDGNICMMTLDENFTKQIITTYQIVFLSSGSVTKLNIRYININIESYYILPLFYGGSIITSWSTTASTTASTDPPENPNINLNFEIVSDNALRNLSGHIIPLNNNDSEYEWDLNPIATFSKAMFDIMMNNTYILYVAYNDSSWDIFSKNVEKFRNDSGYENPNVISTYPKIKDTISPRISSISLTLSNQISKSSKKLYIYQINTTTNQYQFRQFYSGNSENCTVQNNTILCDISQSIINRWNSSYAIVVDNNFIKFASTDEPIYGIAEKIWTFNTSSRSATVIVRLTHEGTGVYDSLSESEKSIFLNSLLNELIESIPTTPGRLLLTNRIQYDPSTSPAQYLLQIEISGSSDLYQVSVPHIINDMESLIINKDTSIMSFNNHTKYLDSSYGVKININFWDEIKYKLLGASIGLLILILDILFIVKNGKDVPSLYLPSIIILCFAILTNLSAAILFISYELKYNKLFAKWIYKYINIVPIFVILSGSNVMILDFLTSNFGGFELFDAPFLDCTRIWIFWGSIAKTIIENIPQFIIQILYFQNTVKYEAIPFLTLVTGSIVLLNDIILKLFKFINKAIMNMAAKKGLLNLKLSTNNNDQLYNDVLELLHSKNLSWEHGTQNSIGISFINELVSLLYYLDNKHKALKLCSLKIPSVFLQLLLN